MLTDVDPSSTLDMFITWFPDFIGCVGAVMVLFAYAFLQMGKIKVESFMYSFLNLIAAFMILISLFYAWNLAAALIEIAWIGISAYGVMRGLSSARLNDTFEESDQLS